MKDELAIKIDARGYCQKDLSCEYGVTENVLELLAVKYYMMGYGDASTDIVKQSEDTNGD